MSRISVQIGPITGKSSLYLTPCFPSGAGPDYVNSVIIVNTGLTAGKVLSALHNIEAEFGRERVQRWGQRSLDLDLLALDSLVLPSPEAYATWRHLPPQEQSTTAPETLILPHPRIQDRAFVLVPLVEIAPNWRHPVSGHTAQQMLDVLPVEDKVAVKPSQRPNQ